MQCGSFREVDALLLRTLDGRFPRHFGTHECLSQYREHDQKERGPGDGKQGKLM